MYTAFKKLANALIEIDNIKISDIAENTGFGEDYIKNFLNDGMIEKPGPDARTYYVKNDDPRLYYALLRYLGVSIIRHNNGEYEFKLGMTEKNKNAYIRDFLKKLSDSTAQSLKDFADLKMEIEKVRKLYE